jgi:hypothetical protein
MDYPKWTRFIMMLIGMDIASMGTILYSLKKFREAVWQFIIGG